MRPIPIIWRIPNLEAPAVPAMTPTRLRECIETIGWTQRGLARMLERQEGTVRQWARGVVQIPEDVGVWLERLAKFHDRNPAPKRSMNDE